MNRFLRKALAHLLFSVIFVSHSFAHGRCQNLTKTLDAYLRTIEENRRKALKSGKWMEASHFDFDHDRKAATTWTGIEAPRFIAELLPANLRLIDHTLKAANEPGVVKDAGSGEFISVRYQSPNFSTNLGVSKTALLNNASRSIKTLVRDEAKAVLVFMHGGGTRTTGHHVGINLMNNLFPFGIDTISFDQPWHGEADRKVYRSPREYFEDVRAMIRATIAPSLKPIFLAGHSMGGEFADMYRRLYPNDDLIAGVVVLSSVPGAKGGTSVAERIAIAEARDEAARSKSTKSPEDQKLMEGLIKQNKLSYPAFLFESLFSLGNTWEIPEDGGKSLVPALYVWGERDWLYVGNENLIRTQIASLPKTTVKIYGARHDFVDNKEVIVGHMIFDHNRPGTDQIEALLDIREFIEKTADLKLEQTKIKGSKDDLPRKMIQTYANNLVFREFANDFVARRRQVANPALMKAINQEIARLQSEFNAAKEKGESENSESKSRYMKLIAQREGYYLPLDSSGDLGRKWEIEREALKSEELRVRKLRDEIREKLESVQKEMKTNLIKPTESAEALRLYEQMNALNIQIEKAIYHFYLERLERTDLKEEDFYPTQNLRKLFAEYENLSTRYQKEVQTSGNRNVLESLDSNERALRHEISELEAQILELQDKLQVIDKALVEGYSDGLFEMKEWRLIDLLNTPAVEREKYTAFFQIAWSAWQILWKERPPSTQTSLY